MGGVGTGRKGEREGEREGGGKERIYGKAQGHIVNQGCGSVAQRPLAL